ncbi:hypothetical protein ABVK25_007822 [Lepraria finkii]|uniref:Uncharacterized protein n=1 Tax=Lepraria finkii TaxID=1340010 RepID=A0ABR4B1Y0_9LECA
MGQSLLEGLISLWIALPIYFSTADKPNSPITPAKTEDSNILLYVGEDCVSGLTISLSLRADAESMSVINIVAGQIIHKERTYNSIWDPTNQIGQGLAKTTVPKAVFEIASATSQLSLMSASDANFDLQGMASQRLAERIIIFAYAFSLKKIRLYFYCQVF